VFIDPKSLPAPSVDPIASTLRQFPDLFNLSPAELEKLVGEVIREPGFLEFCKKIEEMWRIRAFIGR